MDQPGVEIYVAGALDTDAHAMPPSCHKYAAIAGLRGGLRFAPDWRFFVLQGPPFAL